MNKDIQKYIASCESCQRNKSSNQQPTGLLQPLSIPTKRWEQVTMDFIVQLPITKQKHDAIVVFVNKLTKRAHYQPTVTSATAPDIAKIFFNTIFRLHGLPKVIISDRDSKFTSKFWKSLFEQVGTKLAMSTAFHLQTDSQTERINRTIKEMLRSFVNYKQDNQDEYLPAIEFTYNNSKQTSTGFTSFELDCRQTPETLVIIAADKPNNIHAANKFILYQDNIIKIAKDSLQQAQENQEKYANQHRRFMKFEVGDQVLLSIKYINSPIDKKKTN